MGHSSSEQSKSKEEDVDTYEGEDDTAQYCDTGSIKKECKEGVFLIEPSVCLYSISDISKTKQEKSQTDNHITTRSIA